MSKIADRPSYPSDTFRGQQSHEQALSSYLEEGQGDNATIPLREIKHIIHDLNHHLMLISLASDELSKKIKGQAGSVEMSSMLHRNIEDAISLLSDLSARGQLHGGACKLGWAQLDLIMNQKKYDWRLVAGDEIKLVVVVKPFEGYIHVVPLHLMRILTNFIHNAVDAFQGVHKEKPEISIIISQDENWLMIDVRDNGKGVPEELCNQLFTAGVSSKNDMPLSTSAHQKAPISKRGYGLSYVASQARLWGGIVKLASTSKDAGSHFVLSVPLKS